ncbi:HK97 gp10 family phage protein [Plantactinospora sp. WMMB782]|uniref:HK97 gp10 family phage protein n=1 Tax=Plantactinospora sp. WMMB782 TaxID=3404121 RepID=UPI003B9595F9
MAVKVRFKADRAGINNLVRSDMLRRECERRAELVRWTAQQIAPVRTGRYRASMTVTSGTRTRGAYARVTANAPYSVYVEFGNRLGAPRQRVMLRALQAARG